MRITLRRVMVVVGALVWAVLTPAAHGAWVVQPVVVIVPLPATINVQTTVAVPDGGTVTVGGLSSASETRSEYGAPGLGKVPYLSRGYRNTAYGRRTTSRRVNVRVRIIDLREEEYRQTGYRSP
jgi:general secretion pathway protein D